MPAVSNRLRPDWREVPHPRRLPPEGTRHAEILQRHRVALDRGVPVYADPLSGLSVFTADFLARRGSCCDSGCRHCPYVPLGDTN